LSCDRETLYEDESFPQRELAALVTAKVYFHLGEYNESMVFALGAGKLFDLEHESEFEETIICEYLAALVIQRSCTLGDHFTPLHCGSAKTC
jgi:26S proteasome regulatory subunit N2